MFHPRNNDWEPESGRSHEPWVSPSSNNLPAADGSIVCKSRKYSKKPRHWAVRHFGFLTFTCHPERRRRRREGPYVSREPRVTWTRVPPMHAAYRFSPAAVALRPVRKVISEFQSAANFNFTCHPERRRRRREGPYDSREPRVTWTRVPPMHAAFRFSPAAVAPASCS